MYSPYRKSKNLKDINEKLEAKDQEMQKKIDSLTEQL
jgi:hypothetical protein